VANSGKRDEGLEGPRDRAKGGAEAKDALTSSSEDERDEGRSARERRVQEEKKAASPGPSGS
jgi:hypothetical protein